MTDIGTGVSRRTLLSAALRAAPLLLAAPLLGACARDATAPAARFLRISQASDPRSLDPQKVGDLVSMNALANVFDCLTTRTVDNELGPRLATSWTAAEPTRWRFTLRRDVRFHDGEPFDARSVQFSIDRLLAPETASPIVELRYVTGVEVLDDHTVDIVTDRPDPILPAKLSLFGGVMLPPGYLDEVGDEGFAAAPVGTGPFRFDSWRRSLALRLSAVEEHWDGAPSVPGLEFQTISNPASALAALQSDEVDMVTGLGPDAALQLQGYRGIVVGTHPGLRTSYLSLDTTDPVLADVRVRRALNHAVDVPLLIDTVLDGRAREVPTMIPRESFGFDPSIAPYPRDQDTARALLAEAGHADGFDTTLTASNADSMVAQAVAGLLARVGVRARVELLDPSTYSARLTSDNSGALGPIYLAASTGWTLDGQSNVQSNVRTGRRQSRWSDPRADALIDRVEGTVDPAQRQDAFSALQRLLSEEAPFVFLHQVDTVLISNESVSWTPNVIGVLALAEAEVRDV